MKKLMKPKIRVKLPPNKVVKDKKKYSRKSRLQDRLETEMIEVERWLEDDEY